MTDNVGGSPVRYLICASALMVGLSGCWKPKILTITPRDPTPDEIKHAISQLPEGFRSALPDMNAANASRLDLHVWAFDFEGGPFKLIIETTGSESDDKLNMREPRLGCDA